LDLTPVYEHGGLDGNLLSAVLDHPAALRGVAGMGLLGAVRLHNILSNSNILMDRDFFCCDSVERLAWLIH
jgi:hypothetical protein